MDAAAFDVADPQRAPRGCAEDGLELGSGIDLEEGDLSRRLDGASSCFNGRVAESLLMTPHVLCAEHPLSRSGGSCDSLPRFFRGCYLHH